MKYNAWCNEEKFFEVIFLITFIYYYFFNIITRFFSIKIHLSKNIYFETFGFNKKYNWKSLFYFFFTQKHSFLLSSKISIILWLGCKYIFCQIVLKKYVDVSNEQHTVDRIGFWIKSNIQMLNFWIIKLFVKNMLGNYPLLRDQLFLVYGKQETC